MNKTTGRRFAWFLGWLGLGLLASGALARWQADANAAQADGSTTSYAQRYALCDAFGIVISRDTDATIGPSSDKISAEKAAEIKLVNFSFPADKLREETLRVANDLKKKNPAALRATKEAVRHVRGMNHDQAYQYLAAKLSELNLSFTFSRFGVLGKDFQDDCCPVNYFHLDNVFKGSTLRRR